MSFTPQDQITSLGSVGATGHSAPSPVQYKNNLYLFFNSRDNDGIYETRFKDPVDAWEIAQNLRSNGASNMGVAANTGPSAVVYRDKIFVFYNGVGNDGVYYTTSTGLGWTSAVSVRTELGGDCGFLPGTSPSAVVFDDWLYVFWIGSGADGIFYATYDGRRWDGQHKINGAGIAVRDQTSPATAVFQGALYVFYNGSGHDGTYYTIYDTTWSRATRVVAYYEQNFLDNTSPAVFTVGAEESMLLLWVTGEGIQYSKFDGEQWAPYKLMPEEIGSQGLFPGSSPGAVATGFGTFESKVFWIGLEQGIWYSSSLSFAADDTPQETSDAIRAVMDNKAIVLYSQDAKTIPYFTPLLTASPETIPPDSTGRVSVFGMNIADYYNWLIPRKLTNEQATKAFFTITAVLTVAFVQGYRIRARLQRAAPQLDPIAVAFELEPIRLGPVNR